MTPETNKACLIKMIMAFDHFSMDHDHYMEELSFQELVDILDYKFRNEMGLTLRLEQIEPLRKHNRN